MCNLSGKCVGDQWHLELIARCPNRVLLELSSIHAAHATRRGGVDARDEERRDQHQHFNDKIISALRRKKLDAACDLFARTCQAATPNHQLVEVPTPKGKSVKVLGTASCVVLPASNAVRGTQP